VSDPINIPTGLIPPSRRNPQLSLLYGPPKGGKTTIASLLADALILELEPAGADFLAARKIDIRDMPHLRAVLDKLIGLREAGTPACKRLVIDTIDEVETLCDPHALAQYKKSVLGKDFAGTSILELPQGAGYGRLRDAMGETLWLFSKAAEEVILLGHVREKFIERKGQQEVAAQDVALTGKCRAIVCSRCSSIGYVWRDFADRVRINFKTSDTVNCGSRCQHLTGQEILISERVDGVVRAYWDKYFLPDAPPAPPLQTQSTTTAP
jgi:hypothetical protein